MDYVIIFVAGSLFGAALTYMVYALREKETQEIARELLSEGQSQKVQDLQMIIGNIKDSFGALSLDALSRNTEEFLKLAGETLSRQTQTGEKELEGKKKLIDQTLETMKQNLQDVQTLVVNLEKDREQKFGELAGQLKSANEQTRKLQETTGHLNAALASTKVRGQWGERMAEDVLRMAGFVEGINYVKQQTMETVSTRPDYTFLLPQNLKVNMDVKFPFDNYLRYREADSESDKETYKNQFLKDVKNRVKEVTTRNYINPEENTVDYVIVFIPNEQVYAFINENDSSLLDDALRNKVILCSPITLYAILAVIRQAVDNFTLEKTAAQIVSLLGAFQQQWTNFVQSMERMGKRIEEAQKEYYALTSTRRNQLERSLRQIEDLRSMTGHPETPASEEAVIIENNSNEA